MPGPPTFATFANASSQEAPCFGAKNWLDLPSLDLTSKTQENQTVCPVLRNKLECLMRPWNDLRRQGNQNKADSVDWIDADIDGMKGLELEPPPLEGYEVVAHFYGIPQEGIIYWLIQYKGADEIATLAAFSGGVRMVVDETTAANAAFFLGWNKWHFEFNEDRSIVKIESR